MQISRPLQSAELSLRQLQGHPLQAVVWLAQALAAEQLALQPGDWVSLGSFSPLMPPQPGQQVQVRYDGVPGLQPVSVRFE